MAGRPIDRWRARADANYRRVMRFVVRRVPPGARTLVGLVFIVAGVFGFLPVLGFWMIPLGIAVILTDVGALRRWWRRRRR